jgi:hypothetical protein
MIPVLGAAGLKVMKTFSPVWIPTPVARMTFLSVLCLITGSVPQAEKTAAY